MRQGLKIAAALVLSLPALAGGATPATDAITHLPVIPSATEPMSLPETQTCKSKMQTNFYSVGSGKVSTVVAWYGAHLNGFRKTHAYNVDRSQDTFYNGDGTLIVSISGEQGKNGEDADTHSVVYARFQPGLPEKEIVGMNAGHLVCE
jgi:hypothetical protein